MEWIGEIYDEVMGKYESDLVSQADTLLLGRVTYQSFAVSWPHVPESPIASEGTTAGAFTLREAQTSPRGVIVASYERAGEVQTGSFASSFT
jgi:dihydrofolate reductase